MDARTLISPAFAWRPSLAALASGLLLYVSGCAIPQLCCPDPGPNLPASFHGRTSEENSAQVGIVEFFDDRALTTLITNGIVQNQELKIRNEEIRIANNEVLARRGAYLPFFGLGARAGVEQNSKFTPLGAAEEQLTYPGGGNFPRPMGNFALFGNLWWQIDIWRELRNARDAAIERYERAIEDRNYFVTELVADIAENYYELAALDQRLLYLDQTIKLQQQSLEVAKAQKQAARGTELGVQRFLAEVRKNESQRFIVKQRIIQVENQINFLAGRYPELVERAAWDFIKLDSRAIQVGVPAQLLGNRRDIRAAERELNAAGLDVLVARARFFPRLIINAGVGFEAFDPKYLFNPGAFVANAAGELTAPLINRNAIQAEYMTADARQLQALYTYQRTILNAYVEVVNSITKVENYRQSVAIKQEQVKALEESVSIARNLFNAPIEEKFATVEYVDVLLATRDLLDARTDLIEAKQQQLTAIVNAYQALGGGFLMTSNGPELAELFCAPYPVEISSEEIPTPTPQSPTPLSPAPQVPAQQVAPQQIPAQQTPPLNPMPPLDPQAPPKPEDGGIPMPQPAANPPGLQIVPSGPALPAIPAIPATPPQR